jgi:hypothetical protein
MLVWTNVCRLLTSLSFFLFGHRPSLPDAAELNPTHTLFFGVFLQRRVFPLFCVPAEELFDYSRGCVDDFSDLVRCDVICGSNKDMVAFLAINSTRSRIEADVERLVHCCE